MDASIIVQLKRAHTTFYAETGAVEIEWPENAPLRKGVFGNEVFASRATNNVYKVWSSFP